MAKVKIFRRIALGAAIAGAAGYITGLLTAPKSGRETRQDLGKAANSGLSDLEKQLKSMQSELSDLIHDARNYKGDVSGKAQDELKVLLDKAKDSKTKMGTVISAVKDGGASDKDLKKAMADARHAIDHIKDFIKK